MKCPRCQQENPPQAKFCLECGARVALTCTKCRSELPAGAKFCLECGEPVASQATAEARFTSPEAYTPKHLAEKILTSKSALEGERKQVTALFAALKGSMELLADRDPEEARKLLDPVLERMMEAVHRYEGTVNQVMGDGIMALFGAPLAHEDHAVRACYASLRMQESVQKYAEEVRRSHAAVVKIRVGLNSGEVVVRAIGSDLRMDYTAVGQTTHLAARMEQLADPGVSGTDFHLGARPTVVLARLRHETFFSLAALNARIAELLADLNARPMRLYRASRRTTRIAALSFSLFDVHVHDVDVATPHLAVELAQGAERATPRPKPVTVRRELRLKD